MEWGSDVVGSMCVCVRVLFFFFFFSWGWSWSKNECGVYVNQNCDRAAAEAADEDDENDDEEEEEEEDDLEVSESAAAASEEPLRIPDPAPIPSEALPWANTEDTTRLWQLVNAGDLSTLRNWLFREPSAVHLRAEDGRGPLFWAYEYNKQHIIDFLLERGADPDALDVNNQRPEDLAQRKDEL
jgi:hypothetical protein